MSSVISLEQLLIAFRGGGRNRSCFQFRHSPFGLSSVDVHEKVVRTAAAVCLITRIGII
jgi:hypothetical protein